jgi:hypothetical protein
MEKTIKEWFESVADPELRQQLLENYDPTFYPHHENKYTGLYYALDRGFDWANSKHGDLQYWTSISIQAFDGNIPMIEDGPRELTPQEQADSDKVGFRPHPRQTEEERAIALLKSLGYRIQKPVTTYEEV